MFINVDLPAPFSPSTACTSPAATSRSRQSLATTPGKRLVSFSTRSRVGILSLWRRWYLNCSLQKLLPHLCQALPVFRRDPRIQRVERREVHQVEVHGVDLVLPSPADVTIDEVCHCAIH